MKIKTIIFLFSFCIALSFCTKKNEIAKTKNPIKTENKIQKPQIVETTDSVRINGLLLELINNKGKAELKVHSNNYILSGELKLTPPCYFLYRAGKIQDFAYPDVKVLHTLGILGNIFTEKEKENRLLNKKKIWGEGIQGVLIKKDSVRINKKAFIGKVIDSRDLGLDEIDFWGFAHRDY